MIKDQALFSKEARTQVRHLHLRVHQLRLHLVQLGTRPALVAGDGREPLGREAQRLVQVLLSLARTEVTREAR